MLVVVVVSESEQGRRRRCKLTRERGHKKRAQELRWPEEMPTKQRHGRRGLREDADSQKGG